MKKMIPLFLLFLPFLAFGQTNFEIYGTSQFSKITEPVLEHNGRVTFGGGMAVSGKFSHENLWWVGGVQLSTFGDKQENNELRWGSQHDGEGGYDPTIESGSNISGVKFEHTQLFLEMPLGVRYVFLDKNVKLFFQPSLAPSLYLTTRHRQTYTYKDGEKEKSTRTEHFDFRTINLNMGLGFGLQIPVSEKTNILIEPQGGIQLLSTAKNGLTDSRLYSFGLRAELQFGL